MTTICPICKKKVSLWSSYTIDNNEYHKECWEKNKDKVENLKLNKVGRGRENFEVYHKKEGNRVEKQRIGRLELFVHIIAIVSGIYGIYIASGYGEVSNILQQIYLELMQTRWILIAILLELFVISFKINSSCYKK